MRLHWQNISIKVFLLVELRITSFLTLVLFFLPISIPSYKRANIFATFYHLVIKAIELYVWLILSPLTQLMPLLN